MERILDDDQALLDEVPFGRNRFLRCLAGAVFGTATALVLRNEPAEAHHFGVPWPCEGFERCHHCDGRICTAYCSWYDHSHCRSGGQCWNTCVYPAGNLYRCCDWHQKLPETSLYHCICVQSWGRC